MEEKKFRVESDLLGELQVPADALYGVQTQRGINNYKISCNHMCDYPDYVISIAYVKLAAILANNELGVINDQVTKAVEQACREVIAGKWGAGADRRERLAGAGYDPDEVQGIVNNMLKQ